MVLDFSIFFWNVEERTMLILKNEHTHLKIKIKSDISADAPRVIFRVKFLGAVSQQIFLFLFCFLFQIKNRIERSFIFQVESSFFSYFIFQKKKRI